MPTYTLTGDRKLSRLMLRSFDGPKKQLEKEQNCSLAQLKKVDFSIQNCRYYIMKGKQWTGLRLRMYHIFRSHKGNNYQSAMEGK